MKKFVIYSSRGKTSIIEVECEIIPIMDHYFAGLKDDEWVAKISKPESLLERSIDKKIIQPVWCWWAFYNSVEECLSSLRESTKESLLRSKRKSKDPELVIDVTEEELDVVMSSIKKVFLI